MKKFRKLIPALALLLVSAVLMSTASYAWFSMNNTVTVTGMEVKTRVSSNLMIATDTEGATAKKGDSEFKSSIEQVVKGILEPVSTANAKTFFYTTDAIASGERANSSATMFTYVPGATPSDGTKFTDKFSEIYGVTKSSATAEYGEKAVAYVDYVFQLKATNTTAAPQYIIVNKLDLTYHKAASEVDNNTAYRVAFFIEDITSAATSAASLGDVNSQYKVTSSANFKNEVISAADPSTATAPYLTSAQSLATVPNDTTAHYFKVTVRMWLEGQDTTCNNTTFMTLSGDWNLDIELSLVEEAAKTSGVYEVTMKTAA